MACELYMIIIWLERINPTDSRWEKKTMVYVNAMLVGWRDGFEINLRVKIKGGKGKEEW
jgi:hypothetical protein